MAKRKADELEDFSGKNEEGTTVKASKAEVEGGSKLLKKLLVRWKEEVEQGEMGKEEQVQRMRELVLGDKELMANPFFTSVRTL